MATEISVRISRNPYQGYEARFWWNGMLNRYSFECQHALAATLADDGVSDEVIEGVMDAIEATEWSETYPLGVVYVGEAACDMGDEPIYDRHREQVVIERTRCEYWKSLCGIATFGLGLAVFSLIVLLGRR